MNIKTKPELLDKLKLLQRDNRLSTVVRGRIRLALTLQSEGEYGLRVLKEAQEELIRDRIRQQKKGKRGNYAKQ